MPKHLYFFLFISLLLSTFISSAQTPDILWTFDTKDAAFGQTAAGDIDGDGKLELVFGCYRNDSSVYALNAEDGSLLWKYNTHPPGFEGCNDVAALIADVDGDGTMEVIVPSSCNPTTFCFDGKTGAVKWTARTRGSDSPPTIADIDNDGTLEILHGEFGGYVICLNAETGSIEWEIPVDTHSWIQTAPTLLDVNSDGQMDFIVATWNRTEGDTNTVRAYQCSDQSLLWSVPLADVVYHGTAVADLDHDGKPELCIGDYSGTMSVLNAEDGSLAWAAPSAGPGHYIGAPVSIADLDDDGWCELVYVSWYKVFAYSHDGQKLWEYSIANGRNAFRGVALADVDGDALPDAVFGTSSGELTAVKGTNGISIWSVDLAADYGDDMFVLDHAPVIADFDNDGTLDVFIVGGHAEYPDIENNFGRAYALDIGKGEGPPWLMFQQNTNRTSSLCVDNTTEIRVVNEGPVSNIQLFPNPAHDGATVQGKGLERLFLIDATGRLLETIIVTNENSVINMRGYPTGYYFVIAMTRTGTDQVMIIKE
jgi:outer membrane protein assembly factor BamB